MTTVRRTAIVWFRYRLRGYRAQRKITGREILKGRVYAGVNCISF